jgi:hypothetical protein
MKQEFYRLLLFVVVTDNFWFYKEAYERVSDVLPITDMAQVRIFCIQFYFTVGGGIRIYICMGLMIGPYILMHCAKI